MSAAMTSNRNRTLFTLWGQSRPDPVGEIAELHSEGFNNDQLHDESVDLTNSNDMEDGSMGKDSIGNRSDTITATNAGTSHEGGGPQPDSESYVVSLKYKSKPEKPIHPFFVKHNPQLKREREESMAETSVTSEGSDKSSLNDPDDTDEDEGFTNLLGSENKSTGSDEKYVVTLRVPSSRLKQIKKKPKIIHPFFLKHGHGKSESKPEKDKSIPSRPASAPPTGLKSSIFQRPKKSYFERLSEPWPRHLHIRGLDEPNANGGNDTNHERSTLLTKQKHKSKRSLKPDQSTAFNHLPKSVEKRSIQKPEKRLMHPFELRELASQSVMNSDHPMVSKLIDSCGLSSAFDDHTCENLAWTAKYAPTKCSQSIASQEAKEVLNWTRSSVQSLKKRKKRTGKQPKKKKRKPVDELDDFIVDDTETGTDEDSSELDRVLIVHGPSGAGKTASIVAAAKELNAYIFEINSSSKRTGKELIDNLEGMGTSQLVHSSNETRNQDSLVLVEEADVLFQDESSFWSGLTKFVETAKRPIILTCNDISMLPDNVVSNYGDNIYISKPNFSLVVDIAFLVALCEGHLVERQAIEKLTRSCHLDLRMVLTQLQFWCQMGIGGRKSGIDWMLTAAERRALGNVRVISQHPYVQTNLLSHDEAEKSDAQLPDSIAQIEAYSAADILRTQTKSALEPPRGPIRDALNITYTSEQPLTTDPLPFEPAPYKELARLARNDVDMVPEQLPGCQHLRIALEFASSSYYSRGTFNSIDCSDGGLIASEIAPYIRQMAHADKCLELYRASQLQQLGDDQTRTTRRSYATMGIETRPRHLDCSLEELDQILRTW
uniref:ARAD1A18722p n=1 Tax=Blastobotrys adeninivorans TaxID=409370 RepID=A0A060T3T6_BLAAD